jgi:hypothetical protein
MSRLHRGLAATVVCALGAAAVIAIPSTVLAAENGIRINEVESNGGEPGDWVEFYNPSDAPVVLDGYVFKDSEDGRTFAIPAGTTIAAGGYYVLDEKGGVGNFDFGLGGTDSARLYDTTGQLVDERSWTGHAATTYGVREGATPDWQLTDASTKGAANTFPAPAVGEVRINEVESSGGSPGDWVEFYNPTDIPVVLDGYVFKDSEDGRTFAIPSGTTLNGKSYYVLDEKGGVGNFDFGLGADDSARLYDTTGTLVDERSWTAHASTTYGVRDGATPDWQVTSASTRGVPNTFPATEPEPTNPGSILINEVDSAPAVSVEFYNPGATALDISGYEIRDNADDHRWSFLPGTSIAAGQYLVVEATTVGRVGGIDKTFSAEIGIGSADRIRLFDRDGALIDETHDWTAHASINGNEAAASLARCPDGVGAFRLAYATKGATNSCVQPTVAINEVESDGGSPEDWIELVNPTAAALDVSGIIVKDSDDTNSYAIPAGTMIAANGYLVLERETLGFGLSGSDAVRLFEGTELIDQTSWTAHADATWGRCPDVSGAFGGTYSSTKGAANICEAPALAWPGAAEVQVLDPTPTFLEDSSGLDTQVTASGSFLWAVDNGTGTFWKLAIAADGSVSPAAGWENGKRARFQKDAANAAADGPDAEGITVAGDGFVYLASERDNSNDGVNQNVVLKVDPNAPGPVVSTQEWDLTAKLPNVKENLGLEAVEWVSDTNLVGSLVDSNTGALYQPTRYPGHGGGLFFVAMEGNGHIYAFALNADGSSTLVSEIVPGLTAVMALDYDAELDVLWAVCDNGCDTTAEQITLNGTATPGIVRIARPAGLPNLNNEGFATLPTTLVESGSTRPAWWFTDGPTSGALRLGSLPYTADPTDPEPTASPTTEPTTEPTGEPSPNPTITSGPSPLPATGGGSGAPLPGDMLIGSNRGDVTVPASAAAGSSITVSAGAQHAGTDVQVWMYSTPVRIATGTLDAAGRITVTLPADAVPGTHRIAVFTAEGALLGWASIEVTRAAAGLAVTGSESPTGVLWLGGVLIAAGVLVVVARRRGVRTGR